MANGDVRFDSESIKNIDDILIYGGESLKECKEKMENFRSFCRKKNLKLNKSKFMISEEVECGRAIVSADTVKGENVGNILPKNGRITNKT